ncbi:SPOR domain-containing protein [Acidiferrobacter sp.]|uniref:SPOR domain-containing protein n=1 Tax=Acidiferrobacter sp. TaxID=1872107 RepID=UPI0026136B06|nr:SPOR domain-containing protein [Acidiferrobacter sp.]
MEEGSFDAKRRIVGAAILVTVAVVVLPILLRRPPSSATGREILTVRRATHGVQAVMVGVPASVGAKPAPPMAVAPAPKPAPAPTPPAPVSVAPATPPAQSPVVPEWYVQVGAYVNAAYGIAFAHKLKEQGLPAHVKLARLAQSRGVIVVLGPYGKGQARTVQQRVRRRNGIQGFVIEEGTAAR